MAHKEIRKIIKAGKTSFAIVLPMPWCRFYGLKNGDSVEVVSNGAIHIKAPHQKKPELTSTIQNKAEPRKITAMNGQASQEVRVIIAELKVILQDALILLSNPKEMTTR